MDYIPWVEREIWPFLNVPISLKPKRSHPPKLVCMYVTSTPICMNFLSRFRSIKFFDDQREIWPFFKVPISLKLKRSHPPKLVCIYVTSTPICMNFLSRFRSIKFFDDHGLYHGSKRKFGCFLKYQYLRNRRGHAHQNWCACMLHQHLFA